MTRKIERSRASVLTPPVRVSREARRLLKERCAGRLSRVGAPPVKSLVRIRSAASRDIRVARLAIGLFETIIGRDRESLFPRYPGGLLEWRQFPDRLKKDVRALVKWALSPVRHDLLEIHIAMAAIKSAVYRMRRRSVLGRAFRHRAARLMRQYPPLPTFRWSPSALFCDLLPEETGAPLTERTLLLAKALGHRELQIVPDNGPLNHDWIVGALTIRLSEDGYTVRKITIAVEAPKQPSPSRSIRIEGELVDYFETGTEGTIWMLDDNRRHGKEALEPIREGDCLTIMDQMGKKLWQGVIRCDKKVGWRRYRYNRDYGQQAALGRWVHWIQRGFKPDDWAAFFMRPDDDRLRGVLVRKIGSKRYPRLGGQKLPPV
jgi:hypothetical protein